MTNEMKVIIGNEEWCAFPTLAIPAIKARVDTGAQTSSLHAFNIKRFKRDNVSWLSFEVHPLQSNTKISIRCKAKLFDRRSIKNTSGISEKRYVIQLPMQMGNFTWNIELTLANRDSMGYRMLLGRNAMQDLVLIDPSKSCCLGEKTVNEIIDSYTN